MPASANRSAKAHSRAVRTPPNPCAITTIGCGPGASGVYSQAAQVSSPDLKVTSLRAIHAETTPDETRRVAVERRDRQDAVPGELQRAELRAVLLERTS